MPAVMLMVVALVIVLPIAVLGGAIAFGTVAPPPPMASVNDPFRHIDYSDVPAVQAYRARDGAMLAYRAYPAGGARVAVLVHGSSGSGQSMHLVAKALREAGVSVYALDMRGHGASGTPGDIGYVGQLDDDIADFMQEIRPRHPKAAVTLLGFSSGGGFALRVAGGSDGALFDRYVLVSPALHYTAPTFRPGTGGWTAVHVPRIIAIGILHRIGIRWFDGLPVIAFAVAPDSRKYQVGAYSYRLNANFTAREDYLDDIRRAPKPITVLVGGSDEVFYPEKFAPLFHSAKPDIPVSIVPGLGHIGMITAPAALVAITDAVVSGPAER